ncbi:MAG: hypothetical protein WD688_16925 [Candidatus Binatia bacterium]
MKLAISGLMLGVLSIAVISMTPIEAEAESKRLEPTLHARALERANDLPRLRSLLISIDSELVEERYFNGARASYTANLKSASKEFSVGARRDCFGSRLSQGRSSQHR